MGTAADPDEYLDTTDEDWARAHAFRNGRYLGPALDVIANGWEPVVSAQEQQLTQRQVMDQVHRGERKG